MRTTVLVAVPTAWETSVVDAVARCPQLELMRRCADVPELLSTAAAGLGAAAIVGAGLAGLDRSSVAELRRCGVRVVGVAEAGDEAGERLLRALGVAVVLPVDAPPERLGAVLAGEDDPELRAWLAAVTAAPAGTREGQGRSIPAPGDVPGHPLDAAPGSGGSPRLPDQPGWRPRDRDEEGDARRDDGRRRPGRLVAVWGPAGAPGRSSVALGLASEAARFASALLVDADPYGGVQAQALALLDEAAGLAGAIRSADHGGLDVPGLAQRVLTVAPGLGVLTGISRADRWPELRADPLEQVLVLARELADLVVVDCGFCLENDEELSYDTAAPRRNAATLTTLAVADHLVVVGAGEPLGLHRLVRGLQELGTVRAPADRTVVINRLRASAVGERPREAVAAALRRFAGLSAVRFIPDDRDAFDRAALQGRTLAECAPDSPARAVLAQLAAELLGAPGDGERPAAREGRREGRRAAPREDFRARRGGVGRRR